jgi:hypothetical protein
MTRSLGRGGLAAVLLLACATAALAAGVSFRSPTGNIRCSIPRRTTSLSWAASRSGRAGRLTSSTVSGRDSATRAGTARCAWDSFSPTAPVSNGSVSAASPAIAASPAATSGPGRASPSAARAPTASLGGRPTPCTARRPVEPGSGASPRPAPAPTTPKPPPPTTRRCSPTYSPCVPDVPYDLDCADIGMTVRVIGTDVYRLDGDGDGMGYEPA